MADQPIIDGELRKALRQVQLLETDLWDAKLDPTATRHALELVRKGQFEPVPGTRSKRPRRPKKPVYGYFTPVESYPELIAARRDQRGWRLSDQQIEQFAGQLVTHAGRLQPTGARLWLGESLRFNWDELRLWALDMAAAAGLVPNDWVNNLSVAFWPGSERGGEPSLEPCGLDFETYWCPQEGIVPRDVQQENEDWPGLEVATFCALNPRYMVAANAQAGGAPFLLAGGLRIDADDLPWFRRSGQSFGADFYWRSYRFHHTSLVGFRELQH